MNDEIKEILARLSRYVITPDVRHDFDDLLDYITNLQQENERLNKEVAKLHIIQEEYGSHIENTHIIDDYQKTYFMTNKWLIELKDGRFVDINVLNSYYEDYKSRVEKAVEYLKNLKNYRFEFTFDSVDRHEIFGCEKNFVKDLLNILQGENNE